MVVGSSGKVAEEKAGSSGKAEACTKAEDSLVCETQIEERLQALWARRKQQQ